jgi:hypothetical protein
LPLASYTSATSVGEFQERFLKSVVERCAAYYRPIAGLASAAGGTAGIPLFDLCRASFVERGAEQSLHRRTDRSVDGVVCKAAAVYERYVESDDAADWLWSRITGSAASRIVALGRIAEHGLLRLFARHDLRISPSSAPSTEWKPKRGAPGD